MLPYGELAVHRVAILSIVSPWVLPVVECQNIIPGLPSQTQDPLVQTIQLHMGTPAETLLWILTAAFIF